MIILKATTESLQITTGTAAAIDYSVSYADITASTFVHSSNEGKISSATTTSALSAPGSSVQRQVKTMTISNTDTTLSCAILVQKLISSTAYNVSSSFTLLPGETVQYVDGMGWMYYSATGAVKGSQAAFGSTSEVQVNVNGSLNSNANLAWASSTNTLGLSSNPTVNLGGWSSSEPVTNTTPYVASVGAPASGSAATLSVAVPSGVAIGDLVIIGVGVEWNSTILPDATSISIPGFTVAQIAAYQSYTSYTENNYLFYKYASAADTGTYTITFNNVGGGSVDVNAAIASIVRGGPTSGNPFVDPYQTAHSVGSTTVSVSSFTPTASNSLLFASIWCDDGVSVTNYPSGWTSQANGTSGNGMMIATLQQITPAATGTLTWNMASGSPDPVVIIGTIRSPLTSVHNLPTNGLSVHDRTVVSNPTLALTDTSNSTAYTQSSFYQTNSVTWTPSSTTGVWNGTNGTTAGTAAVVLPTTTNNYTAMRRSTFSSIVTTTNQVLGISSDAMFFRGGVTSQGGFFFICRFGFTTIATGMRAFIGFAPSATVVSANPSASANILGFGFDLADTAITFMHNDGTGTATKETISGQATLATNNSGYDAYIWSPPNSSTVYYRLDRTDTGATLVDSSVTTDLPVSTTVLFAVAQMSNGTANTAVNAAVIGVSRLYVETLR